MHFTDFWLDVSVAVIVITLYTVLLNPVSADHNIQT